jgi:serine/threonine-protein kinase SRPK3
MEVRSFNLNEYQCHTKRTPDLHLKNILFHSPSIASWSSEEEAYKYLNRPRRKTVTLNSPAEPAPSTPHVPAYIVITPNPTPLLELCLSDPSKTHVKLCDFSESFVYHSANNLQLRTPLVYAAPEILLKDIPSPASDVWAFAVLTHVFLSGGFELFMSNYGKLNEILREMVLVLGKFPERWWSKWAERGQYFDDYGNWIADPKCLTKVSGLLIKIPARRMDGQEKVYFEQMIRKMVAYEPSERATMAEVVKLIPHGWLT